MSVIYFSCKRTVSLNLELCCAQVSNKTKYEKTLTWTSFCNNNTAKFQTSNWLHFHLDKMLYKNKKKRLTPIGNNNGQWAWFRVNILLRVVLSYIKFNTIKILNFKSNKKVIYHFHLSKWKLLIFISCLFNIGIFHKFKLFLK